MGFGKRLGRKFKKFGRTLRKGIPIVARGLGRAAKSLFKEFKPEVTALTATGLEKVANTQVRGRSIGNILKEASGSGMSASDALERMGSALGRSAVFDQNADPAERSRLLQRVGAEEIQQ